jgi:beta-barrel assembly-enhancing protease
MALSQTLFVAHNFMQKAILQLLAIVATFLLLWFGFSRINWRKQLKIDEVNQSSEEKIGDLFWESINATEKEIKQPTVTQPIDSLVKSLCSSNSIDYKKLKIHIVEKDEINAFALPNNHLVVYSGLIKDCGNEAELLGVLGHEIAHIEKHHIFKKLVKEIGLATIISITTKGGNNVAVKKAIELITSSSYDRTLEREADITSVDYLLKAEINPEPFANFLYRMSSDEKNMPKQIYWITTHPESKERAEDIIAYIKNKTVQNNYRESNFFSTRINADKTD